MIVRRALFGALVVMRQDDEAQLRILVQDLALGHVVGQRGCDEALVLQGRTQQFAHFLAPRRSRLGIQNAAAIRGELLYRDSHGISSRT